MISLCPTCHNLTQYCTCAKVATSGGTVAWTGTYAALPIPMSASSTTRIDSTAYVNISPADFETIRTLVHEEIEKALMDEEDSYEPRVVVIDGKPKIHIEFEYEGQLYAGDAYAVEKKYD